METSFNIPEEVLNEHFEFYFIKSLKYYPERYINLVMNPGFDMPTHVAYLCPMCAKNIIFLDSSGSLRTSGEFNKDHYPAKSVGGRNIILLCTKCNSEAGYKFDFTLKQHLEVVRFSKKVPNSGMKTKTTVEGLKGYFNSRLLINEKGEYEFLDKTDPTYSIPHLDEHFKKNPDFPFNITYCVPDNTKIQKALLHAAYLYCFEKFGYEFVFSDAGELIRKVLKDEEEYPADTIDLNLDSKNHLDTLPIGVSFISKPMDLQSLVAVIELFDKDSGYKCLKIVLIPNQRKTEFKI